MREFTGGITLALLVTLFAWLGSTSERCAFLVGTEARTWRN